MSTSGGGSGGGSGELAVLRTAIEALDRELIDLVARRRDLAVQVGALKRNEHAATLDPGREAAVIRRAVEGGRERGLPEERVRTLFWTLIELCRTEQLEERP